ncbi:MAG TPA: polysaccharide deacetylase family protein [Solirubrobacteraceae bacterium]|jgi:peptidoglycan/xylan/chitin deacetylase (PgdA/CDA1 family)|nr:polysaccharide deacetylase family protein [Solirubrobacteraceae bacterium]
MDEQQRFARRERRRREVRRRRIVALASLSALAFLAVVVIVIVDVGGAGSEPSGGAAADSARQLAKAGSDGAGKHRAGASSRPHVRTGPPGTAPVPILIYHVIAAPPAGAPFPGLYVEPAEFAEQMQALKDAGWHAVTMDEVGAYWSRGVPLGPGKPVVVSFDNGYNSQYTQALPVLRRLGWVGDLNIQLTGLPPSQGGLGEGQVRGLLAAGWELDTQGISHAALITLDAEALHDQVSVARETLRRRYHVPVNWFCYPSGQYDATVEAAVRAAGFVGSTTVVPGWAHPSDDPYRLHRLRVLGGTSGQQLLELLASTREDPPAPSSYTA